MQSKVLCSKKNNLRQVLGLIEAQYRLFYTCNVRKTTEKLPQNYTNNTDISNSLWFTNLPHKKKNALALDARRKKKTKWEPNPDTPVLITCRNEKLNHYQGQVYGKLDLIPLASKGWHHRQSKGDYFTVHAFANHPAFILPSSVSPLTYEEIGVDDNMIKMLRERNAECPTNIQMLAIPKILSGRNTLLAAETGCGKTYAYLVPMIQRILKWKNQVESQYNSPMGIIVVPNRELALQVGRIVSEMCAGVNLQSQTLLGGHSKQLIVNPQFKEVDIVVATLGVLCKLTTYGQYNLRNCKHLVLDEADTLLDDSFNEKLVHFIKRFPIQAFGPSRQEELPTGTQLSLASATMPTSLPRILGDIVSIESLDKISTKYLHRVQPHIPQTFLRISKNSKAEELLKIIKKDVKNKSPVMIFSNKSKTCDWVSLFLNENDIRCIRINSGMTADSRLGQYEQFKYGQADVISCTDIASRGLDTTRVKHIVNFDFPLYMADYIHRCGRTGRIGHEEGCRITSLITSKREIDLLQEIEKSARTRDPLPNVNNNITRIVKFKTLKNEGINSSSLK